MTLMNGSDSGVATDATNQPQVAWHQSSKAHRYMYIFGVGVLVLIALGLVTNAYLLIRLDQTEGELHAVETKLDQTTNANMLIRLDQTEGELHAVETKL